ncbi:MAG: (E)-4-hydroxy-3-methylbut-2-enyl-diphosphate synthase [SAR324 cluster bacterium]|nr:(E)-4-hydroxy-3-methylbut-2-enyl-diphosphate synthase [SAR324 cluster bacterium]
MITHFHTQLAYRRRPTRQVAVGEVGVGGDAPIRIQSMLTCNTWDVDGVLAETRGLVEAGCEIVRLTVPTQKDLEALPAIRAGMRREQLDVPLVADIHFNPRLALGCVPHVEKVRINPGNYVDQKKFQVREYSEAQYQAELERIEEALLPLIQALKDHGRSLRIGVNHGSLSDRIMNRYGDNPQGMVESAMEYLRVLARHDYHQTIVSMKSSNPLVVIQAYRLLVLRMAAEGMDYPLHLGVTEAGDGMDGRLKSAVGIGALLCDGMGDTIRVSLTEPAASEIPAARELVAALEALKEGPAWPEAAFAATLDFARRPSRAMDAAGIQVGAGAPVAFLALNTQGDAAGYKLKLDDVQDFDGELLSPAPNQDGEVPSRSGQLVFVGNCAPGGAAPMVQISAEEVDGAEVAALLGRSAEFAGGALLLVAGERLLYPVRRLAGLLAAQGLDWPLGVLVPTIADGEAPLGLAAEIGSLAADGLLDALVCPEASPAAHGSEYCRNLLQAARLRIYKTEYISCPSCGRTLFDLQETTERIKAHTAHLTGLRIGVMGCIVNGPGEMADADFGYVGGAPGKVNLYKGQQCVERGVPSAEAVERLVALIKEHGRWVEPPPS